MTLDDGSPANPDVLKMNAVNQQKERPVVALCGGVGGAKLALGFYRILEPCALQVVINTGDDFEHMGLHISPDVDTVTYTLAGKENPETGWGRRDETWSFMKTINRLGGETWFKLGDSDLAVHMERTRRLRDGQALSAITADFAKGFGIKASLMPMSDDPVQTRLHTANGALAFQDYFVRRRCEPVVEWIEFEGAERARPVVGVVEALGQSDLRAVVICPSNPFLSVGPILAVPEIHSALVNCKAPVIAVSPIVDGKAVKGPTAKNFKELGVPITVAGIADHYGSLLDGLVIDYADAQDAEYPPIAVRVAATMMQSLSDREILARDVLSFADELALTLGRQDVLSRSQNSD